MNDFTPDELEILYEALTAWEQEPVRTGMVSLLIKTAFIKDAKECEEVTQHGIAEQERGKKARQRKAILLKAKIVQSIEAAATDNLFNNNKGD